MAPICRRARRPPQHLRLRTGILREMQSQRLTKREMRGGFRLRIAIDWKRRARELAIFCVIGAFLTVIRPYNATGDLPLWITYLFWTGLIVLGSYTADLTLAGLRRYRPEFPLLAMLFIVSLTTTLAVSLAIIGIERLAYGRFIPLPYLPRLLGLVWVIAAAMTAVGYMLERSVLAPPPEPVEGASPAETFLSRLPVKYRTAELYAVSAEDHYLRIHTSFGEELILMRLADAMRELAEADGLQVHRSWWVAKGAVRDTVRQNGKLSLVLASGKKAPVSRTFLPAVKAAGLAV
ncbi:LytTr DNA-binding domain protein [Hyphomonas neptunium ATCC 15444]|uniref:LytTr DNA-binding domain protein n=1 Tax=Hyphomonas neptunium (strain ATCC 15444) TaxID=228405 RepID=Q0C5F7_HYPNA|nr:LytTr DNA-binding domain protein [Hyphomonas neptunium ATCC 15444]